jgi:glycerol-3-phosphate dehydrogenase (NAD(P)+)
VKIGILGAGAWGAALAHVARGAGHAVHSWSRGTPLAPLAGASTLVVAVPAQAVRDVLRQVSAALPVAPPLIISAKGIEQDSGLFMNEVAGEVLPGVPAMVLSGPSFAADVVKGLPTAVVLAARELAEAQVWAGALSLPQFRIYAADDVKASRSAVRSRTCSPSPAAYRTGGGLVTARARRSPRGASPS